MIFDKKTLNKNVPIPLYYQLKEMLLDEIKSHNYMEDDPIPTELELSEHFQISRPTVRQAINELVHEGYLYRVKGKGTFLARPKIFQEFTMVIESFNDEMIKKGIEPKTKVLELSIKHASEQVASTLGLKPNSKVIKLSRLRFANNEPILIVKTYLPYDLCPELINVDFGKESLYKSLESRGFNIKRVKRIFEARKVTEADAKWLQMEDGDPVHYFETTAYLQDNTPIEYSLCSYRGDMNKFTVEIIRE